ncbi:hypothetical protein [Streptomyces niveus]|uniref:hypothetical protein n=1 Tax=Streptomyces niveus TaxID=193462 RepID=UPI0036D28533
MSAVAVRRERPVGVRLPYAAGSSGRLPPPDVRARAAPWRRRYRAERLRGMPVRLSAGDVTAGVLVRRTSSRTR